MLKLWRTKKEGAAFAPAAGDGLSGDPSLEPIAPARQRQRGDVQPSPLPSPSPGQAAAAQQEQAVPLQPAAAASQASSKERTPSKSTLAWRKNQASARTCAPRRGLMPCLPARPFLPAHLPCSPQQMTTDCALRLRVPARARASARPLARALSRLRVLRGPAKAPCRSGRDTQNERGGAGWSLATTDEGWRMVHPCAYMGQEQAKLEAIRLAYGQDDYGAMSPIFEIKQTIDVEAERAAEEAAQRLLEEPPPAEEEKVEEDSFAKKKGGFMARFLARKTKSGDDVDGAIANAEAAEKDAAAKPAASADGAVAAGVNGGAAVEVGKGTTGAVEQPTPSKASDAGVDLGDSEDLYPPPPPEEEDEHEPEPDARNQKNQKHDPSRERRRVAFDIEARGYQRWKGLGMFCMMNLLLAQTG